MNAITVLYTLCVVTLCRGTKCGESLDPLQVLDISNVDGSKVTVEEESADGVSYKSYVPKANKDLKRVIDGEAILWKASSEKEKCTLADLYTGAEYGLTKLHIRDGVKSRFECFKKVDDGWQSIEEDDFDGLLEGMKNPPIPEEDAEESVECKANDSTAGGLFSFPELSENAVEEDDSSTGDLHDEIVSPEEHNGGPHDVVLESIGSPTELPDEPILQSPTSPVRLTPQEVVSIPGTPIQAPLNDKGVALDISSPESTKVSVTSRTSEGVKSTLFYPEGHVSIVCIMDSGMPILAEAGTICTEAYIFSKPGFPLLLKVHTNGGGTNACIYFEKGANGWTKVNKDEFDGKLGTMKEGMVRNVDVQNVECVSNTRIGTPLQARGDTPIVNTPHDEAVVKPESVLATSGTGAIGEQVIPTAPPMPEEYVLALLMGQEQDIHMHSQHMPQEPIPLPIQNDPSTQAISQVPTPTMQLTTHMHALPHTEIFVGPEPTPQVENIPMMPQQVPLMEAIPLLPTPPTDIPSTVEPKVTYNTLRNEVQSRVLEEPGEMMMARSVKTRRKLREESVPVVKTVDLAEGDSPSTLFYEVVEDGITHKSYFPKNHTFDKIMDGDVEVWTAGVGEESTLVFTYSKLGHPTILSVYVNGKPMYLENVDGGWTEITDAEFNAKHEAMKAKEDQEEILQEKDLSSKSTAEEPKEEYVETHVVTVKYPKLENLVEKHTPEVTKEDVETPANPTNPHHSVKTLDIDDNTGHATLHGLTQETPFSFDLASPDYSNVTVSKRERNGMEQTKYSPRDGYILTEITHDQEKVWHASGNERCTRALVNSNKDFALLCIDVDGSDIKKRRFRMLEGKWTEMTPKEIVGKILRTRRVSEQEPTECARQALEDHSTEVDSSTHSFEHYDEGEHKFDRSNDEVLSDSDLESDFEDEEQNVDSKTENIPSLQGVINVSNPDIRQCQSFDYSFAGNAIKLVVPRKDVSVAKLVNNQESVWKAQPGEKLEYADIYLNKDKKAELVYLVTRTESGISRNYYSSDNGVWEECTDYNDKMNGLATYTKWKSNFSLDLSSTTDTTECTIFQVDLLGVTTRRFFPKPGYISNKVKDGMNLLWTSDPSYDSTKGASVDRCRSCIIYKRDGKELLEMTLVHMGSRKREYFEKNGSKWQNISEYEFGDKLNNYPVVFIPTRNIFARALPTPVTPSGQQVFLDLSSPDTTNIDVETHIIDGIGFNYYSPKNNSVVRSISENGQTLCTLSKDEGFLFLESYLKDDPTLIVMGIKKGSKFHPKCFEKNAKGEWKNITEIDFFKKLKNVSQIPFTGNEGFTAKEILDLANLYNVDKRVRNVYGVDLTEYHPKNDCKIKIVVDSGQTLWATTGGGKCKFVQLYPQGNPPIISIGITNGRYFHPICFEKVAGQWKTISEGDYYGRLKGESSQGTTTTKEHSDEHTLDIAKMSPSRTDVETHIVNGIGLNYYSPKDGSVIKSVMDNGRVIWKASSENESCGSLGMVSKDDFNLLMLGINTGNTLGSKCFEQNGQEWKEIEERDYHGRLETMKAPSTNQVASPDVQAEDLSGPITLDLSKLDNSPLKSFDYTIDTVPTKMVISRNTTITKLMNGQEEVWKAEEGERCTRCGVHMKGGEPVLVYIERETSAGISLLILSKDDGEWKIPDSYADELTKLRVPVSDPSAFTLDISLAASTSQCTIFDAPLEGIPASLYFPKNGHHAKEIKDGNNPVWKGGEEERAFSVKVYKRDGSPHLLYIASRESNVGCSINRFLKDSDGKWIEICKDEFEDKFKAMKDAPEDVTNWCD